MKKFVALVLSLLLCGVFFMPAVTCAEEKTKIVMWDFWTEGIGAGFYNYWNEKIAQYNEMHPNVEIERVLVPQDEYLGFCYQFRPRYFLCECCDYETIFGRRRSCPA